jgi:hypothetical protein
MSLFYNIFSKLIVIFNEESNLLILFTLKSGVSVNATDDRIYVHVQT